MSKDLIKGFLLAHNAPKEIMDALDMFLDSPKLRANPVTFTYEDLAKPFFTNELPKLEDLFVEMKSRSGGNRPVNCIKNEGIVTTQDLLKCKSSQFLKVPNFGRRSLNIVKDVLGKHGLELAV